MLRANLHLFFHAAVPALVAVAWYRDRAFSAWLILMLTMLVDLDHLLADPVYDPGRCSIGFHPLHRYTAIAAYSILLIPERLRLIGIGLLIHMGLDGVDCVWMHYETG